MKNTATNQHLVSALSKLTPVELVKLQVTAAIQRGQALAKARKPGQRVWGRTK